jgi:predicted alpha/beta hydrolase family esterase
LIYPGKLHLRYDAAMLQFFKRWLYWALDYVIALRWQVTAPFSSPGQLARPALGRPVLILPGIYERWTFMHHLVRALHLAGHPVYVVEVLGFNTGDVPPAAERVGRYLAEHALRDVVIVAHSKGGLIGKYVMAHCDPDHRVERMVAVATPFAGSRYAAWLWLHSLHIFAPANQVIRELARQTQVNDRIVSIYGVFDPHIPESSELPGATNIRLPVMGHFRILKEPAVMEAVLRYSK